MYHTITALSNTKWSRKHRFDIHVAFEDCDFSDEAYSFELFQNKKRFSWEPRGHAVIRLVFFKIWVVILVGVVCVAGQVSHEAALVCKV